MILELLAATVLGIVITLLFCGICAVRHMEVVEKQLTEDENPSH